MPRAALAVVYIVASISDMMMNMLSMIMSAAEACREDRVEDTRREPRPDLISVTQCLSPKQRRRNFFLQSL